MRIDQRSISPTKSTQATSKNRVTGEKNVFSPSLKKAPLTNDSFLIPKAELLSLAKALKDGEIDQQEANSRFVGSVVNGSLKDKLSESDKERIIKEIAEFCQGDADFVKNLQKNLMNLT